MTTEQANMAASLGGRDMSFMHMGSFNDYMGSFNDFGTSQALTTFQPIVVSNRMNPNLLGPSRFAPGMVQLGRTQNNTNNPVNDISKFQHISVPVNQCENLFEGIPTSLELDCLQQQPKRINESNNHLQGVFSDASNSDFITLTNNSLLLQGNQPPVSIPSSVANRLQMNSVMSARFLDLGKCGETWQNAPSLNAYSGDSLLAGTPYSNDNLTSSNTGATLASTVLQIPGNPSNISSNNLVVPVQNSLVGQDVQCQTSSGITDPKFLSFKSVEQKSNDSKQRSTVETNIAFSSSSNSTFTNQTLLNNVAESQGLKNRSFNRKFDINVMNQPSFDTAFNTQYGKTDKSNFYNGLTFSEDNLFGVSKMQSGFGSNGCNFDDLMNEMIKSERDDIGFIIDGEISSDLFSLSTIL